MEAVVFLMLGFFVIFGLYLMAAVGLAALCIGPSVIRDPWRDWGLDNKLDSKVKEVK